MIELIDCINRIPKQLKSISNYREEMKNVLSEYTGGKKISKIVIIASGTSYNAAMATKLFGEKVTDLVVELIYPNMFYHYLNKELLKKDTLYILISQGGSTKLVFDSLKYLKDNGYLNIAITESENSAISKEGSLSLSMKTGQEEYIFRTIGFMNTCALLYWIYIYLGQGADKVDESMVKAYEADFDQLYDSIPEIIKNSTQWYQEIREKLMSFKKFIFSGTSDLWAISQEADIKFMEMVPVFTKSYELEELIHGPQNAFDRETGYFIANRFGEDHVKAMNIKRFINNEIAENCFIVGNAGVPEYDFKLQLKSIYFNALEYMVVYQVLAYYLAKDKGRDLRYGVYPQVVNYIKKTL